MPRSEEVAYEQDRLGNERKKLDEIRTREGMVIGEGNGLLDIADGDTGTELLLLKRPDHADQLHLEQIQAQNEDAGDGTFFILEVTIDNNDNITGSTRRSIDYDMASNSSRTIGYKGDPFTDHIAVQSTFSGFVGVAAYSDHDESSEPAIEN